MALRIFADTNIVIDFIQSRPFELSQVIQLFEQAEAGEIEICISESVVTNALYITGLAGQLELLLKIVTVLCLPQSTMAAALSGPWPDQEDAILYFGALHHGCRYFVTRNQKDFAPFATAALPVLGAAAFIEKQLTS
jgi:predicted nucleic acid-binding protein